MTQQEQQLLSGLIERVNGTQLASKDTDAERMLGNAFGPNPDALYILCQTVLVQQFALENAQRELTAAREENEKLKQAPQQEGHGSFLGNLFGMNKSENTQPPAQPQQPGYSNPTGYAPVHDPAPAYPQQGGYPPQGGYAPAGYPPQGYPAQGYPQQGYGYPQPGYGTPPVGGSILGGGGGGFLQGAMQTAAGVVAGEFAFRAIEDVFQAGGGGRGFEGGNTEVVNNYYEESGSHDRGDDRGDNFGDRLRDADGFDNNVSSDIEDRRGESRGFLGSDDDNSGSNFADDNSGGFDDSSNFDDSGSFDNGGGGNDDF